VVEGERSLVGLCVRVGDSLGLFWMLLDLDVVNACVNVSVCDAVRCEVYMPVMLCEDENEGLLL